MSRSWMELNWSACGGRVGGLASPAVRTEAQPRPPIVFDDHFSRVNTKEMQFVRGQFQRVHFGGGEFVAGGFIPVRPVVVRVKRQADAFHFFAPVGPGLATMTFHHEEKPE